MTHNAENGLRASNYERLVQLAIEQNPTWGWTCCAVCGETSTHAGVVLLPLTATLARLGWCDEPECQRDMAETTVALPPAEEAVERFASPIPPAAICEAVAHTWGRCTLAAGHDGWHRAAFDGGRRWPNSPIPPGEGQG